VSRSLMPPRLSWRRLGIMDGFVSEKVVQRLDYGPQFAPGTRLQQCQSLVQDLTSLGRVAAGAPVPNGFLQQNRDIAPVNRLLPLRQSTGNGSGTKPGTLETLSLAHRSGRQAVDHRIG